MKLVTRAAFAAGIGLSASAAAWADCPATATCYFGTDVTGSASTRATNVNSLAASQQFLAGLTGVGTETFESFADGTPAPITLTFPGAGTATLTGTGNVVVQGPGTNTVGRYPISGTRYYEATSATNGNATFKINFAAPVAAFGFYGIDIGEFGSQLSLQFAMSNGSTQTWAMPYTATNGTNTLRDGSILYAGFTSSLTFTSVTFLGTSSDDVFAFDDMTIASTMQVLPEPSEWALMLTGLAGVGALARARRKR